MSGLLHVPFFDDELLTSYLSRMARANGRTEMRSFLADLGLNARGIVRAEKVHTDKLEDILGHPPGSLRRHGFSPVDTRHVSTRGMVFPSGTVTSFAGRFCPRCLDEDSSNDKRMRGTRMYARFHWALRCVSVCHRHQHRLVGIDRPVADGWASLGQFADASVLAGDFCSLAENWISMRDPREVQATPCPSTGFERFVIARLGGNAGHGQILDAMPLPACIDACELVGLASRFGRLFRLSYPGSGDERAALAEGYDILAQGEGAIRPLLDRLAGSGSVNGPGFHGSLSKMLGYRPASYDPLKAVFRDHAQKHITAVASGNGLDGDRTTVGVVAASVGLPARTVARYLFERGDINSMTTNPANIVITEEIARTTVGVLADVASFEELRRSLGCSVAEIRSIASSGLLKPVFGKIPQGSRAGTDLYSRSAVAVLRSLARRRSRPALHGLVPLREATRATGSHAGEILNLVVRGRLSRVAFDGALPLFQGLKVDCGEIVGQRAAGGAPPDPAAEGEIAADVINRYSIGHRKYRSVDPVGFRRRASALLQRFHDDPPCDRKKHVIPPGRRSVSRRTPLDRGLNDPAVLAGHPPGSEDPVYLPIP